MRSPVFLTGFSFLAMECLVTSWSNQYNSWECQARVFVAVAHLKLAIQRNMKKSHQGSSQGKSQGKNEETRQQQKHAGKWCCNVSRWCPPQQKNPKKSMTCCPWKRSNYSHSWLREQRCRRRSTPCTAGTWEFVPRRRRVTAEFLWDRLIDWPHAWKSTPAKFNMESENQSLEKEILIGTIIFSFHVKLGGCKLCWKIPTFFFEVVFLFSK